MVIVFSILLILLGLLGAEGFVTAKLPATKASIEKLKAFQEMLGLLGLVFGCIFLVNWLDMFGRFRVAPAHFFIMFGSVFSMLALGLVFGLELVRRNLKDTSSTLFIKLDNFRNFALRFQQRFGIAALILGVVTFFSHV